jgi:ubiquinone/menaquinone biosynthesis C-methylase UbiE
MNLQELKDHWDRMGILDPLEAILYHSNEKLGGRNLEAFFATGENEIAAALEAIDASGLAMRRRKALDFGCGIGRLTQALASRFQEVYGVDIAPSMIKLANQYNRHINNCRFVLNDSDDLAMFPNGMFDLVYSAITLQHMQPRYSKNYLRELIRVLTPGGALMFQIPIGPIVFNRHGNVSIQGLILRFIPKPILDATYRKMRYGDRPRMENYWIAKKDMVRFLRNEGVRILVIREVRGSIFYDCRYLVTKD